MPGSVQFLLASPAKHWWLTSTCTSRTSGERCSPVRTFVALIQLSGNRQYEGSAWRVPAPPQQLGGGKDLVAYEENLPDAFYGDEDDDLFSLRSMALICEVSSAEGTPRRRGQRIMVCNVACTGP